MVEVISVNIGARERITVSGRSITSGINKRPHQGAVSVSAIGLESDAVCNPKHHGGPDQAVYLYRSEDYEWWARQLRREMPYGLFGENLTVSGLSDPGLMVGDRLRFADLELEVTAPRIPCNTLAAVMGDKQFARTFMQAARPGIYFRVLRTGSISAGEQGELIPCSHDSVSTVTFFKDCKRKLSAEALRRYLALPIDVRSRRDFEQRLAKIGT